MCETVVPTIACFMKKKREGLAPFKDGADFLQKATSQNSKKQSASQIVILTNMDSVKWVEEH